MAAVVSTIYRSQKAEEDVGEWFSVILHLKGKEKEKLWILGELNL